VPLYKPSYFMLRILVLSMLGWLTILSIFVILLTFPIKLGRFVLSFFVEIADIYAFLTGFYILWGCGYLSLLSYKRVSPYVQLNQNNRTFIEIYSCYQNLRPFAIEALTILPKLSLVVILWFIVLPYLVGITINYAIIIPLRVDHNQTPVFYPYYIYALGLLYLKIWFRLMVLDGVNNQWNTRFTKITQDGIRNMDLYYILSNVISPIMNYLLVRLCVPYVLLKLVLPQLGLMEITIDYISRSIYIYFASLLSFLDLLQTATSYLVLLHSKIRDEKYLIGEQLQNNENESDRLNITEESRN